MYKKLTISIDERVYEELYEVVGKGSISQFIEYLVRPYVISKKPGSILKRQRQGNGRDQQQAVSGEMDEIGADGMPKSS